MQAFSCPDQRLHDPQQFMRLGRLHQPTDLPARAEALRLPGMEPDPEVLPNLSPCPHARPPCRIAMSDVHVHVHAHHSDGTQQIFHERADVPTVSTHADPGQYDFDACRAVGQRVRALGLPTVVVQEGGYRVEALGPGLRALLAGLGA
jgi:hypothetical protein